MQGGGARVNTTEQMRAPAGLRGASSGPSKSRTLASNHGDAFRPPRAKQVHGNPIFSDLNGLPLLLAAAFVPWLSHTVSPALYYVLAKLFTASVIPQAFPFHGHGRRICVCVFVHTRYRVPCRPRKHERAHTWPQQ